MAIILLPNHVGIQYKEYQKRRPKGIDPFPSPQNEREEVVHGLWECGVMVAGWWLHETEQPGDMLQKYQQPKREEAEKREKEAIERPRGKFLPPPQAEIAAALKDMLGFQKAKRSG